MKNKKITLILMLIYPISCLFSPRLMCIYSICMYRSMKQLASEQPRLEKNTKTAHPPSGTRRKHGRGYPRQRRGRASGVRCEQATAHRLLHSLQASSKTAQKTDLKNTFRSFTPDLNQLGICTSWTSRTMDEPSEGSIL